jgi:hypothetical protein
MKPNASSKTPLVFISGFILALVSLSLISCSKKSELTSPSKIDDASTIDTIEPKQQEAEITQSDEVEMPIVSEIIIPTNRFALLKKVIIPCSTVDHPYSKNEDGSPLKIRGSNGYFFVCLSEETRSIENFIVTSYSFEKYAENDIFSKELTNAWEMFDELPTPYELAKAFRLELKQNEIAESTDDYDFNFSISGELSTTLDLENLDNLADMIFGEKSMAKEN